MDYYLFFIFNSFHFSPEIYIVKKYIVKNYIIFYYIKIIKF